MSDAPRQPPPKKEVALALLHDSSMFIHLDPRRPDVVVPKWFMNQPQLVLQVGRHMAIPIPDLEISDTGISCTLSFSRAPFWCRIPWSAVYALVGEDGRGGVWADDVPPEIQAQKQAPPPKTSAKKPRAKLSAVGAAARARAREEQGPEPDDGILEAEPVRTPAPPVALAAVPSPPAREEEPASSTEGEAPSERPSQAPPGKKAKREIPPWLRVIK
jgi:stringent starvation protein B